MSSNEEDLKKYFESIEQQQAQMLEQDSAALITMDRRDLFDAVRTAIRHAMIDQGSREDDADLFGDATNRADECLSALFGAGESK